MVKMQGDRQIKIQKSGLLSKQKTKFCHSLSQSQQQKNCLVETVQQGLNRVFRPAQLFPQNMLKNAEYRER